MLETGALAPHFTLLGIDGREYRLPNSMSGQPGILVFFKTTCETCDLTFPYLNRLRESYADGWHLWAIAQDPADRAMAYAGEHGITYPVLIDAPGYDASRLYDPAATPALFLVDDKARMTYSTHGFVKEDINSIAKQVAGWLGGSPLVIAPPDDGNPSFKPG